MALHFILDGYNVIKQSPSLAELEIEQSRLRLIRWLEGYHPQGSVKNAVTVVFDGHVAVGGYPQYHSPSVKVLFSYDESADDVIKRMVTSSESAKSIVVVTNDREIQYFVRGLGARVLRVEDFLEKGVKPTAGSGRSRGNAGGVKKISCSTENQINAELEKIWLKKNKEC